MHLPVGVLKGVAASDIINSRFGSSPQYLSGNTLLDFFVAVVTLPYAFAVCTLNFVASVTSFVVSIGLQALGSIVAAISAAVNAAETAVVNAFKAFVAWAIQTLQTMITIALSPFAGQINSASNSYCCDVNGASIAAQNDMTAHGNISKTSGDRIGAALVEGLLFSILLFLAYTIGTLILAADVLTGPMAFLSGILEGLIISYLVVMILSSVLQACNVNCPDPSDLFVDAMKYIICGAGGNVSSGSVLSGAIDGLVSMCDVLCTGVIMNYPDMPGGVKKEGWMGILFGAIAIILTIWGTSMNSYMLTVVGFMLGGIGIWQTWQALKENNFNPACKQVIGVSIAISGIGTVLNLEELITEFPA